MSAQFVSTTSIYTSKFPAAAAPQKPQTKQPDATAEAAAKVLGSTNSGAAAAAVNAKPKTYVISMEPLIKAIKSATTESTWDIINPMRSILKIGGSEDEIWRLIKGIQIPETRDFVLGYFAESLVTLKKNVSKAIQVALSLQNDEDISLALSRISKAMPKNEIVDSYKLAAVIPSATIRKNTFHELYVSTNPITVNQAIKIAAEEQKYRAAAEKYLSEKNATIGSYIRNVVEINF